MSARLQDQALALAGVAQFARHAHELASHGRDRPERMDVARHAIFCTDPDTTIDVYGSLAAVDDGISFLKAQLGGRNTDAEAALVARYMGQLLRLGGRLQQNEEAGNRLRGIIDRARLADSDNVEGIFDEGYRNVISPLKPRIMLRGHPSYLENPILQARARTLLLAAVRCAYMWRQCGGGFATLFLRRKALLQALNQATAST